MKELKIEIIVLKYEMLYIEEEKLSDFEIEKIESIKLKNVNTHETVLELEVPTMDIGFETGVDDEWLERLRVRG